MGRDRLHPGAQQQHLPWCLPVLSFRPHTAFLWSWTCDRPQKCSTGCSSDSAVAATMFKPQLHAGVPAHPASGRWGLRESSAGCSNSGAGHHIQTAPPPSWVARVGLAEGHSCPRPTSPVPGSVHRQQAVVGGREAL